MTSPELSHTPWKLWVDGKHSPAMNMAFDDALLKTALQHRCPVVRFYEWDCSCFSIGCFQDANSAPKGASFVRRPTGGGVVDHRNDLTYTVVFPDNHPVCLLNREESYAVVNGTVIQALQSLDIEAELTRTEIPDHVDRRKMVCFTNPTKYDVVLGNTKIAGAAQRRCREGILHQGSIVLDLLKNAAKNEIRTSLEQAFTAVLGINVSPFTPSADFYRLAEQLRQDIYSCDTWNYKR